jgi:hypothetical protein
MDFDERFCKRESEIARVRIWSHYSRLYVRGVCVCIIFTRAGHRDWSQRRRPRWGSSQHLSTPSLWQLTAHFDPACWTIMYYFIVFRMRLCLCGAVKHTQTRFEILSSRPFIIDAIPGRPLRLCCSQPLQALLRRRCHRCVRPPSKKFETVLCVCVCLCYHARLCKSFL